MAKLEIIGDSFVTDLRFLPGELRPVRRHTHPVVELVARVDVQLEVRRDCLLDVTVQTLLHHRPNIFVIVLRSKLLVQFVVVLLLESVGTDSGRSCRILCFTSLASLAPIIPRILND